MKYLAKFTVIVESDDDPPFMDAEVKWAALDLLEQNRGMFSYEVAP